MGGSYFLVCIFFFFGRGEGSIWFFFSKELVMIRGFGMHVKM